MGIVVFTFIKSQSIFRCLIKCRRNNLIFELYDEKNKAIWACNVEMSLYVLFMFLMSAALDSCNAVSKNN